MLSNALLPAEGGGAGTSWIGAGPSAGVQLPSGRLLGAVNSHVGGTGRLGGVDKEYMLISDSHGKSWRRSDFVPGGSSTGLGEASIAVVNGGAAVAML